MDYKKAGVDIEAGYRSVELMKEHVKKTMRPEVLAWVSPCSARNCFILSEKSAIIPPKYIDLESLIRYNRKGV